MDRDCKTGNRETRTVECVVKDNSLRIQEFRIVVEDHRSSQENVG